MKDPYEIEITIQRRLIDADFCFVAKANGFPDVCVYEPTWDEAYETIIDVIGDLLWEQEKAEEKAARDARKSAKMKR